MRRFIIASIAYLTAGIGVYHTFSGGFELYGFFILMTGLLGILSDIFIKS
ncbi:hypothetical protein [Neobacillus sp. YIM B06451]|nr:hypothetical protein [Neobacillus sp. YIM B06451]